jgi:hypothetical protein
VRPQPLPVRIQVGPQLLLKYEAVARAQGDQPVGTRRGRAGRCLSRLSRLLSRGWRRRWQDRELKGAHAQLCEGVGPHQYGAGRAGGAQDEVNLVRAAADIWPERALATLDVKNAFGSVHWDHALKVALVHAPRLAPALAIIWGSGETRVHAQSAHACWAAFAIKGSLIQGKTPIYLPRQFSKVSENFSNGSFYNIFWHTILSV